jgi:hypothetical protein
MEAQKMLEMGLIDNVGDYAKYAELPNRRDIIQRMAPNVAKASREHARMAKGEAAQVAVFDDHGVHITEHNNFRLTLAYEQMSVEEQNKVDIHIQAHETLAAEAAAKMQARQQAGPALGAVPSANNDPAAPPLSEDDALAEAEMMAQEAEANALPPEGDPGSIDVAADLQQLFNQ